MLSLNVCTGILFLVGLSILKPASSSAEDESSNIVFVILSQPHISSSKEAQSTKDDLVGQIGQGGEKFVHLLHETWRTDPAAWTVLPIFPSIYEWYSSKAKWLFIGEESTRVKLKDLEELLSQYDPNEAVFLGKALRDREATIIHHFAFHEDPTQFSYPQFAAGMVLSMELIHRISQRFLSQSLSDSEFSIDPAHELALYIWDDGNGTALTNVPQFCVFEGSNCITTTSSGRIPVCREQVSVNKIYFAVKTCEKFHKERLPVVKDTWGQDVKHIGYFSNKTDEKYATKDIGIPNTERGHCAKTLAILHDVVLHRDLTGTEWVVITDDDTLLSVPRLQKLLSCYHSWEALAIGERYGFNVGQQNGYNYITGGGGIVLSMTAARQLTDSGRCECPSDDYPDDMFLGICMKRLAIPIVHSSQFHQARPQDYSAELLNHIEAVSFHKHWLVDPYQVYSHWLVDSKQTFEHSEL